LEDAAWTEVVLACHRQVGVALAEKWNLPADVSQAIGGSAEYDLEDPTSCTNLICLANALAKQAGLTVGAPAGEAEEQLVAEGRTLLGLDDRLLVRLCDKLEERIAGLLAARAPAGAAPPPPRPSQTRVPAVTRMRR
jgi:hypothetical protein